MKRRTFIAIALTTAVITACGSTSQVRQALPDPAQGTGSLQYQVADISASVEDVPGRFEADLRKYLEKDLKKHGILASDKPTRKVSIRISEFSMAKGASRVLLGALAGKDYVKADINVVDTASNKIIGSTTIESSDRLAGGSPVLFASHHAKAISDFLQGKR